MVAAFLSSSRTRPFVLAVILLCVFFVLGLLQTTGRLMYAELLAYDVLLTDTVENAPSDKRILLVKITEDDLDRLGHWPLTDGELAAMLDVILRYKPRVVGIDMYRDVAVPPGTDRLRKVFEGHDTIVNIFKVSDSEQQSGKRPGTGVTAGTILGFNDLTMDSDTLIRRGLLFMDDGETTYSSFSLLMALAYLQKDGIEPEPSPNNPDFLKLGAAVMVPLNSDDGGYSHMDSRGYQYLLDYGSGPFSSITYSDLVDGKAAPEVVQDRLVIVGTAADSVKDLFFSPVRRAFMSQRPDFGMEVHAQMASQLLRLAYGSSKPMRFYGRWVEHLWMIGWGLMAGAIALKTKTLGRFFLLIAAGIAVFLASTYAVFHAGIWMPAVPAFLSYVTCGALSMSFMTFTERSDRKTLMQLFSRHVTGDVAELIWQNKDKILEKGRPLSQKLTATVLFVDVKDFTSVAERLDPQDLMDWLNTYLESMAEVIMAHGGIINKFIGDAIMAVFGVPFARVTEEEIRRDALNAVTCAVEMGRAVERLNGASDAARTPKVMVRIGIHTGPLVAGCVGSAQRLEYTVLGDTVNIASRLESLRRENISDVGGHEWRTYVGEATWGLVQDHFEGTYIGNMELKGKKERVNIYCITGYKQPQEAL